MLWFSSDKFKSDEWKPISSAPDNGTVVEVYAEAPGQRLPPVVCLASYHPDAGWCVDELRECIAWRRHIPPRWAGGE